MPNLKLLWLCPFLFPLSAFSSEKIIYDKKIEKSVSSGKISYFIQSKKGKGFKNNMLCEDGLFYSHDYLAVFDGATDKSGRKYDGQKGGRISRDMILNVFKNLAPNKSKEYVLDKIYTAYQLFYNKNPEIDFKKNPLYRPTSTLIWYNFKKKELVAIGDSKARIDGKLYNDSDTMVDTLNSEFRKIVIQKLGLSVDDVKRKDIGRAYIMPLLKNQSQYQNNLKAPKGLQYWVIDGFPVPSGKIKSWVLSKEPKVIELSSDGYLNFPRRSSVDGYESGIKEVLKNDPLRIKNPSTKGLKDEYFSFDDRAVLIYEKNK